MKSLKEKQKQELKDLKTKHKLQRESLISETTEDSNSDMPAYTKGEEIFNMVSHIVGGALAIAALVTTLILSITKHDGIAIFASVVYSMSMLVLYTMSSIYHGLSPRLQKAKKLFRKFDYISIFLLIAGSYTIFLLMVLRPADPKSAWTLFGILWGTTALGALLNSFNVKKFIVLSNILFLVMGWSAVWKMNEIIKLMHPTGFLFLVLGGVAYTLGVVFYILGKKAKYMHSIFHLFVLLGSILQFVSIVGFVL